MQQLSQRIHPYVDLAIPPSLRAIVARAHERAAVPASRTLCCQARDAGRPRLEFLALILSVHLVEDFAEALDHILRYTTGHADAILTEDQALAQRSVAEVAISTQKLQARTDSDPGAHLVQADDRANE